MEEERIIKAFREVADFTEVKTLLTVLLKDFDEHKLDDDKNLSNLYTLVRELPVNTRKELELDMKEKYVTKTQFEVAVAQFKGLKWFFVGATGVSSLITWALMVYVYISKVSG